MMLISYVLVPYQIAFGGPNSQTDRNIEIALDIVILIDMMLNFIIDSYSNPGQTLNNK
jgi:hypothetical protein